MLSRLFKTTSSSLFFCVALFLSAALFTGCADGVFSAEDEDASSPYDMQTRTSSDDAKFRHAHLLNRAVKPSAGKSASTSDLGLIIAVQSGVDKQRVVDRYKIANRFKVANRYRVNNRYSYDNVFNGFAWVIEDSLGLGDYQEFLDTLALDPDIIWFEPDFDVTTPTADPVEGSSTQQVPWSVATIGGQTSWTISGDSQGSVDVDLYILDTGISNDDINVVESVDFRDGLDDATDYDGHGTHVAGIAAAIDDLDGLVGVAPGARVHNLKVLGDDGKADVSIVIAGIEHVMTAKLASPSTPMVVNMSLGEDIGTTAYAALDDAVAAASAAGVTFVVAAGNQTINANTFTPAHVDEAITVGSHDVAGVFSSFSNFGRDMDILAPGEDIISLTPSSTGPGTPATMTGTSMSAAHVSGAAVLYLAQHPAATPDEVRQALQATAQSIVTGVNSETTDLSVWVGQTPTQCSAPVTATMLTASADARIRFGLNKNQGLLRNRVGKLGEKVYHSLIRFDTASLPAGATIESATLRMYETNFNGSGTLDIGAHRLDQTWVETGTNWNTADGATPWSGGPGGTLNATAESTTTVPVGNFGWYEWNVATLVQDWVNTTLPNHGIAMVPVNADYGQRVGFSSREAANPGPELAITYCID